MIAARFPGDRRSGKRRSKEKIMIFRRLALLALLVAANPLLAAAQTSKDQPPAAPYYPDATWQHKTPAEAGINPQP
jgi:hypothetical protein